MTIHNFCFSAQRTRKSWVLANLLIAQKYCAAEELRVVERIGGNTACALPLAEGVRHECVTLRRTHSCVDPFPPIRCTSTHTLMLRRTWWKPSFSRHIFEKCMKEHMEGSLRILVTHQLQYLPDNKIDHIIVFDDVCSDFSKLSIPIMLILILSW